MSEDADFPITRVLEDLAGGREGAADQLLSLVYQELHRIAKARMRDLPPGNSFQPTALVHDAYDKLFGGAPPHFENRRQFFMAAARAMRNILVDHAREKARLKRGGGLVRVDIDRLSDAARAAPEDLLALNEAVERLDEGRRRIVELRFFAGFTVEEVAETLAIPPRSLAREWRYIRARLHHALTPEGGS
jgi:RNA polymerase sigma factor (TIGR02999 family)